MSTSSTHTLPVIDAERGRTSFSREGALQGWGSLVSDKIGEMMLGKLSYQFYRSLCNNDLQHMRQKGQREARSAPSAKRKGQTLL